MEQATTTAGETAEGRLTNDQQMERADQGQEAYQSALVASVLDDMICALEDELSNSPVSVARRRRRKQKTRKRRKRKRGKAASWQPPRVEPVQVPLEVDNSIFWSTCGSTDLCMKCLKCEPVEDAPRRL